MVVVAALLGASVVVAVGLVRRGIRWGSTPDELTVRFPGDEYLEDGPEARTMTTRAISISAPPEAVWPCLIQMGRGAGWYSYDRIDNGGKESARHIVSWIPPVRIGDASAIGWLRNLESDRSLTWWLPGERIPGTTMRMVVDIRLDSEGHGSRLMMRVSGDATGTVGTFVMRSFEAVDSIMAIRQLKSMKARVQAFGVRSEDPDAPETGDRDQFQLYEAIWNSGERAGTAGREKAALWRQGAENAGVLSL